MRHLITLTGQFLTVALLVATSLTAYGCGSSTLVNPGPQLASLSVSDATLQPPFASETTGYGADLSTNTSQVTVATTKSDPDAGMSRSVTVGAGQSIGQANITLNGPGTAPAVLSTVAAQNGIQETYTITINREVAPPPPSSAPDLVPEDDSGFNPGQDSDNMTNVTHPRFRIPQPGSEETPHLYVDGNKVEALFNSKTNTLRPTEPLGDGVYKITSTVTNNTTGLESAPSEHLTVTIDTGSPGTPRGGAQQTQ